MSDLVIDERDVAVVAIEAIRDAALTEWRKDPELARRCLEAALKSIARKSVDCLVSALKERDAKAATQVRQDGRGELELFQVNGSSGLGVAVVDCAHSLVVVVERVALPQGNWRIIAQPIDDLDTAE